MKPAHGLHTTLFALLLVAFSVSAFAQNDDDCQTIEGVKGTSVSVDPNGNVYVIDGSTLYKLTQNGRSAPTNLATEIYRPRPIGTSSFK